MRRVEEAKVLAATLARMDSNRKTIPERPWFYPVAWLGTVFVLLGAFQLEKQGIMSPPIWAFLIMMIGIGVGWAFAVRMASRSWPAISPHLNRGSIEKRLAELRG